MEALLGHGRGRGVGVGGHNSFEVFLTGGPYGKGKWALLDHDISTVIFDREGTASAVVRRGAGATGSGSPIADYQPRPAARLARLRPAPRRRRRLSANTASPSIWPATPVRRRWSTCAAAKRSAAISTPGWRTARRSSSGDATTTPAAFPAPSGRTPGSTSPRRCTARETGAGYRPGQARFANAVYTYRPDFADGDYREGVVEESDRHVVFEFYTPYIIAATPPNNKPWGIYDTGCRNGLVLRGRADCAVSRLHRSGQTWQDAGKFSDGLDLTDRVKGRQQYFSKLHTGAKALERLRA